MATHNQVRVIGYLLKDPKIINEDVEGAEKIIYQVRTTRRDIEGFRSDKFTDIMIYYDGTELMSRMKKFKQYDIVDVKGVFNILPVKKRSICPVCGCTNVKETGTSTFIYPQTVTRYGSYADYCIEKGESPDSFLEKNYEENSNQCLIIGTVVTEPEIIRRGKLSCCRYGLGVDRKYYINTQDDQKADYPWIYSYGAQAELDATHLQKGAVIFVDGFVHNVMLNTKITCINCDCEYTFKDVGTQFTPYSIEYLNGHKTDEDLAREEETERMRARYEAYHNN